MSDSKAFKMVVVGAAEAGKSAFCHRVVSGEFRETYEPTVEDLFELEKEVRWWPQLACRSLVVRGACHPVGCSRCFVVQPWAASTDARVGMVWAKPSQEIVLLCFCCAFGVLW